MDNSLCDSVISMSPHERANEYEKLIQQLEGEVRSHIRTEQQLKLHIETMQQ